jgi:RsiW-degrading membrane proteinase PrsW (M82 family)
MFPIAITYAIWIPLEIIFYGVIAYISRKNNETKKRKLLLIAIALNFIPLWAFIAPDSPNMAFDVLLYDTIMVLTLTSVLMFLGSGSKFKSYNWLGAILAMAGFILMKL